MAPLPARREGPESVNKSNSQLSQRSPAPPLPARREGPESVNKSDSRYQLSQCSPAAPLPARRKGSGSVNKSDSQPRQRSPAAPLPARREGPESVNKSDSQPGQRSPAAPLPARREGSAFSGPPASLSRGCAAVSCLRTMPLIVSHQMFSISPDTPAYYLTSVTRTRFRFSGPILSK